MFDLWRYKKRLSEIHQGSIHYAECISGLYWMALLCRILFLTNQCAAFWLDENPSQEIQTRIIFARRYVPVGLTVVSTLVRTLAKCLDLHPLPHRRCRRMIQIPKNIYISQYKFGKWQINAFLTGHSVACDIRSYAPLTLLDRELN